MKEKLDRIRKTVAILGTVSIYVHLTESEFITLSNEFNVIREHFGYYKFSKK
jgi:hypothetical protein